MANKYYAAGEDRAAKVNDLFAAIATRYDLINDLQSFGLHRFWKRRLVTLADPAPGESALDVCCGTGDVSFALARQGAEVIGLDFSEAMLAMARSRSENQSPRPTAGALIAARSAARNPQFIRADAQALPFPDAQFDLVTVSYGLRNLARWQTGLQEMWRVAKPGGRLLVLDFGKPNNPLWRELYFAYLRWCVPLLGKLLCGDSQTHAYILESLNHYPAQQGVAEEMRKIDCRDVRLVQLLGGAMSINYGRKA